MSLLSVADDVLEWMNRGCQTCGGIAAGTSFRSAGWKIPYDGDDSVSGLVGGGNPVVGSFECTRSGGAQRGRFDGGGGENECAVKEG